MSRDFDWLAQGDTTRKIKAGSKSQFSDSIVYALLLSTTLHYLRPSRGNRGQVLYPLQAYLVQDGLFSEGVHQENSDEALWCR